MQRKVWVSFPVLSPTVSHITYLAANSLTHSQWGVFNSKNRQCGSDIIIDNNIVIDLVGGNIIMYTCNYVETDGSIQMRVSVSSYVES